MMAPATITEFELLEKPVYPQTKCKECKLVHELQESNINNNNIVLDTHKTRRIHNTIRDVYDESLPKNDPKFLAPIRRWEKRVGFVTAIRWTNVILITFYHFVTFAANIYHMSCGFWPKWQTVVYGYFMGQVSGFGVTAGAHRYWCHRSYKAKLPLQIILMLCYSTAGQNDVFNWVRDHRVHHKFSETYADPHDARRGLFFSHVGWLMMKKHPDVIREGKKIDMSDIVNDPLLRFHSKYFIVFKILCCFVLPTLLPVYAFGETWTFAILSQPLMRYALSLNFTWSVNSFAHMYGNKPYDRHIMPSENWGVSMVAMGEGWHNYHHTFPWDYKAAEMPYTINLTTILLDGFAKIGWAYDRKEASQSLIRTVSFNRGDDSHKKLS